MKLKKSQLKELIRYSIREIISEKNDVMSKKIKYKDKEGNEKEATIGGILKKGEDHPAHDKAQAAESLVEKISKLEKRVASLEEGIITDRFSSNPKVSFPESAELGKKFKNNNAAYQAHGKAYSSMIGDLKKTTNRVSIA